MIYFWNPSKDHIPLGEIDDALGLSSSNYELIYELKKPAKDDPILVYCMSGVRAENAAEQFDAAGFREGFFWHGKKLFFKNQKFSTFLLLVISTSKWTK